MDFGAVLDITGAVHILFLIKKLIFIFKMLYNLDVNFANC